MENQQNTGAGLVQLVLLIISVAAHLRINNNIKYTSGLMTDGPFTISDFTYNSTAANGYNNGIALTVATGGDSLNFNGVYAIGRYAGGYYAKFDVAEIIIYNSALSSSDRILVEQYLNAKYAIY